MNASLSVAPVFVGADVSKHRLDVHLPGRPLLSIANDARGVRRVVDHLASSAIGFVAVEATGGYERLRVRRYAQGRGVLAKTDSIDAAVLADFARDNADRLHPLAKISDTAVMLQELTGRRRQLVCQVTANKNQREHVTTPLVRKGIARTITNLQKELAEVEAEIQKLIDADPAMKRRQQTLLKVTGIGLRVSG